VHETYRNAKGEWIEPSDARLETHEAGRKAFHAKTGEELKVGALEKMSKSKRNTVGPEDIARRYGADTARWFMLSDSPPERDVEWTDAGVEGAHRHVQRVWRFISRLAAEMPPPHQPRPAMFGDEALDLRRHVHRTIDAVTQDLERLRFNRAVAQLYELTNVLGTAADRQGKADFGWALREGCEALVLMFAPMMPHLAEECWRILGHESLVAETAWPEAEAHLLQLETVLLPVQVNGKKRDDLKIPASLDPKADAEAIQQRALASETVARFVGDKVPKRVIYVPGRLVNIVL